MMGEVATIVATAVTVAATMAAAALFVLRLVIAKDIAPLTTALGEVRLLLKQGIEDAKEQKATAKESSNELREILTDLREIVSDHETRLTVLEKTR